MTLEAVWDVLEEGRWASRQALKEAAGVDEDTLTTILSFLDRWNFIDVELSPEPLIRRKPSTISPIETLNLLRQITERSPPQPTSPLIAQRLACRVCNGHDLSFVGVNEVECDKCHEKQWYTLERTASLNNIAEGENPAGLSLARRMLVRLGRPQKAFRANIPNATQYFWFRCTNCGKTSTDYAHGHAAYFTCSYCQTRSRFS